MIAHEYLRVAPLTAPPKTRAGCRAALAPATPLSLCSHLRAPWVPFLLLVLLLPLISDDRLLQ